MDRAELERLDRETLVLQAQAAGIRRARLLTRPEIVDELLRLDPAADSAQLKRTRGFFGRARDLLTRVVERGLHLPDAADRLRAALGDPLPQVPRPEPQAVPTLTLAEIYAAQGHKQRAIETLKRVLEAESDHGAARALLEKLEASDYVPPPPALPPEADDNARDEIGGSLGDGAPAYGGPDDEVEPETSRLAMPDADDAHDARTPGATAFDECVAIPIARGNASYVWWRLSAHSQQRLVDQRASAFVVRAVVVTPTWDGPEQETRDVACDPVAGEVVLRDLPERAIVRVAVGIIDEGSFVPFAHSPSLEMTPSRELVRWTLEGTEPVVLDDLRSPSIARAAARMAELGDLATAPSERRASA